MPDHVVKLHYVQNPQPGRKPLFRPEPKVTFVKRGQTIAFKKAQDSVPGKIHITFHNPEIFSAPQTDESHEVTVIGVPMTTTYHCELLDDRGVPLASSDEDPNGGGDIMPDPPPSA